MGCWHKLIFLVVVFLILGFLLSIQLYSTMKPTILSSPPLSNTQLKFPPVLSISSNKRYGIQSLSKDMIVHSAYFDPRPRNGHDNVTVLLVNVHKSILDNDLILGCGAYGITANDFSVYSIYENVLMHHYHGPNPYVYENILILCYDLPAPNGSNVFAVYKTLANSAIEMYSYSREPLFHPAPRVPPPVGDDFSVMVCTKIHDKNVPWVRQFIQYQKTIGVDHIHFSMLDTFIKDDGYENIVMNDPVVLNALLEGYISFHVWPETYTKFNDVYLHSENLRKLGCIYKYIGTYDYVMPIDTDDFFMPVTRKKKLKDYIKDYCYGYDVGSCRFIWVSLFPDCGIDGHIGPNGNITNNLHVNTMVPTSNFKSLHHTKVIRDASFHDAACKECLAPGYRVETMNISVGYMGHIRLNADKNWRKKVCGF